MFATRKRQGLIYKPTYVESGAEFGIYVSDIAFLTGSSGNHWHQLFVTDPTYTANLKITPHFSDEFRLFFGGSAAIFKDPRLHANFETIYFEVKMYGVYIGLGIGDFVLMGEYDMPDDYFCKLFFVKRIND